MFIVKDQYFRAGTALPSLVLPRSKLVLLRFVSVLVSLRRLVLAVLFVVLRRRGLIPPRKLVVRDYPFILVDRD